VTRRFKVLTLCYLRCQSTRGVKTDIKQQPFRVANFPSATTIVQSTDLLIQRKDDHKQYAIELQAEITTRGVLATAKYLCTFCLNQMKRTSKRQQSTMNDDDPTTSSQANSIYAIPKQSILNGHFDC
jgi:hypothetical protein